MYRMFGGCGSLTNLNLANFKIEKKTDTSYMFSGCKALKKENIIVNEPKIINNL